jgi:hypothetical protein
MARGHEKKCSEMSRLESCEGHGMSEFAMTTAEIYRVESKSRGRSEFSRIRRNQETGNSVVDTKGLS